MTTILTKEEYQKLINGDERIQLQVQDSDYAFFINESEIQAIKNRKDGVLHSYTPADKADMRRLFELVQK